MEAVSAAIRERRSIRRYADRSVPDETIGDILAEARWAPSAGNTQSTRVFVVRGAALDRVKAALREAAESESAPAPDIASGPWPEPYQTRMATLFKTRADFVAVDETSRGVAPADPPTSPLVVMAGLFGAPVLLLLAIDEAVSPPSGCFDAGLFAQTVALAAHARGLGTCIMTSTIRSAAALHRTLPEADGTAFVAAITLGYSDPTAAVNQFPRERVALEEFATYVG